MIAHNNYLDPSGYGMLLKLAKKTIFDLQQASNSLSVVGHPAPFRTPFNFTLADFYYLNHKIVIH